MDIVKFSIKKPVTITVGVILILLFGLAGLNKLPYQLTPNVSEPEISVTTNWNGATPYEIEREIIEEQEKALKSIVGLVSYESTSSDNQGKITLKFAIGTKTSDAMLEVSNKLNEVDTYPENVDKPIIKATGESTSPIIFTILQKSEDNPNSIDSYKTFFENEIQEKLERIEGIAELFIRGGTPSEVHIVINPTALASHSLTIPDIINTLKKENINVSAGSLDMSRRAYRVRTTGEFQNLDDLKNVVLISDGQKRVKLGDVANIIHSYKEKSDVAMIEGIDGIVVGFKAEPYANVVDVTNEVERVITELNNGALKEKGLYFKWLHDQRGYIIGSIELVKNNILVGGILAVIVLLLFLRSITATAIIGVAIPISVIATFIIFEMLGRSLNTISLAGISFAVGMLVDSAIVVLENIDRHRQMGKGFFLSAYDGTNEVWGALIASALTTIAVFLPIIFLENEAGQLFKDIAIAVTASVIFSLFVSISVIPMLFTQFLRYSKKENVVKEHKGLLVRFGSKCSNFIMAIVNVTLKNKLTQALTIFSLTLVSILAISVSIPKMEYLPEGNRNLIFNLLIPPPGLSVEEKHKIGDKLFADMLPYMEKDKDGFPQIERLFFATFGDVMIFGARSKDDARPKELIPLFIPAINQFPGVFGISKQAGVFEQGIGKGRTVDVDISGESIEEITNIGGMLFGAINQSMKGSQVRPVPSVELLYPEVKVVPDRDKLKALGTNSNDFGVSLDVLMDGRKISEFKEDGKKKVDLILKANDELINTPEKLYETQIAIPNGKLIPISSISELERTTGISSIRHYNGKRTITLQVTPPANMSIQEAMEVLNDSVIASFKQKGLLGKVEIHLTGTADKLVSTVGMLEWNFIMAVIIIYLLMAALFENFIYPLLILFTVPLATAGGFIGLKLTNMYVAPQPLDILTMLGFIILLGIVVNNAILIVHQSLNLIRFEDVEHKKAVIEATKSRLRPIYMSSLTSVFGMLPLVLVPGPGAEFYRGLGSVITGGLAISTIFTIFITPALLMFFIKMEKIGKRG